MVGNSATPINIVCRWVYITTDFAKLLQFIMYVFDIYIIKGGSINFKLSLVQNLIYVSIVLNSVTIFKHHLYQH